MFFDGYFPAFSPLLTDAGVCLASSVSPVWGQATPAQPSVSKHTDPHLRDADIGEENIFIYCILLLDFFERIVFTKEYLDDMHHIVF